MGNLVDLSLPIEPITPNHLIGTVGDIFLQERYERLLSLPVVSDGRPVGVISRHNMQKIFMTRFGREIQGNKPVAAFMNPLPLLVSVDQSMEEASHFVTRNIAFPITEDFILVKDGQYHGIGSVIDLLRGMEERIVEQNLSLSKALSLLKASQSQIIQSEKMASLGQMVAGVAHEINTPLGYVKNNLEMAGEAFKSLQNLGDAHDSLLADLQSGNASDDDVHQQLNRIEILNEQFQTVYPKSEMDALFKDTLYGLQQISEIVVNLKNFSRLDQAAVDNVNINQCIDSALLIAKNVVKHKAEVERNFGTLPAVRCAPSQINQVILNLITNAAHAIDRPDGRIVIRTQADQRHVHIVVTDNGKGIPPELVGKIFDPFFTTKPVGQGTGLGLSIAFKIVQDHCGSIRVKSRPGLGTAFCVSLPVHVSAPVEGKSS
ncbi:MAG: ATPase [Proteobacteria bacterium]|nr:ATPase [Pseudomonadota bacterium]